MHLRVQLALLQSQLSSQNESKLKSDKVSPDNVPVTVESTYNPVEGKDVDENNLEDNSDVISYVDDLADEMGQIVNKSEFLKHSTAKYVKTSSIDLPASKDVSLAVKVLGE